MVAIELKYNFDAISIWHVPDLAKITYHQYPKFGSQIDK